jgi:hypothetical protein
LELAFYLFLLCSLFESGEYGFKAIAEVFGFAKNPMIRRIQNVDDNIPVWFIYGGRSWIDHTPGFTSIHLRQNSISTTVKVREKALFMVVIVDYFIKYAGGI